jgi:hypothetical protein
LSCQHHPVIPDHHLSIHHSHQSVFKRATIPAAIVILAAPLACLHCPKQKGQLREKKKAQAKRWRRCRGARRGAGFAQQLLVTLMVDVIPSTISSANLIVAHTASLKLEPATWVPTDTEVKMTDMPPVLR